MPKLKFSRLHTVQEAPCATQQPVGEVTSEPPRGLVYRLTECITALVSPSRKKERAHMVARETCNAAIETLTIKEQQMQQKADEAEARCALEMRKRNTKVAVGHLRRKKFFLAQVERVQRHRFSIESHLETLDESATNEGVVGVMQKVTKALRKTGRNMSVELVDSTVDDLNDIMDDAEEVSQALRDGVRQAGPSDDELEAELMGVYDMPKAPMGAFSITPPSPEPLPARPPPPQPVAQ